MEASGDPLDFAVRARELRVLAERPGPVASVYLTTEGDVENASQLSELRWRALRGSLAEQGASEGVLEVIDPLVPTAHAHGACLAVIAAEGELLHAEYAELPPAFDFATYDQLPVLAPLVRWRQLSVPHLVVIVDRRGADIVVVGRSTEPETRVVEGYEHVHKAAAGGWAMRRYHRHIEHLWEENAREAADEVRRAGDDVNAELIIVAGDGRAIELLEKHLPDRLVRRVEELGGGARNRYTLEDVEDAAQRWVASVAARYTTRLLETFREERGQRDRAADGVDATFDALSRSQVAVLLACDDWRDGRRASFGTAPIPVSCTPEPLRELGIERPEHGRLVDVAIRAALGTGAGVWIVPKSGGPADGLGAVLRWS